MSGMDVGIGFSLPSVALLLPVTLTLVNETMDKTGFLSGKKLLNKIVIVSGDIVCFPKK